MPVSVKDIVYEFAKDMHRLFGKDMSRVVIYGSYARGDYTPDSDVDIMLLVDLVAEEADVYSDALSELGYEYNVNYNIWMMPVVKNLQHFKQWVAAYPLYTNVQKEGVTLYDSA